MVTTATVETNLGIPGPNVEAQIVGTPEAALSLKDRRKPIVVRVKGKKKKRKYSRGLKGLQRSMRSSSKGGDRLLNALAAGFGTYRKRANKSSKKRRDGMVKDLLKNSAAGLGKTLRKSSNVPSILAKSVKGKSVSRQVRALSRVMGMFR